jgi:radical SAM superfamily enzyme YgiQ (UPF0313 family)
MRITFIFDDIILLHQPLGAGYISSVLKEAGHQVTAINIDQSPDYLEEVKKLSPDILAYSVASSHAPRYVEVNREIKKVHNAFSLFGGPHPTFFPQMIEQEGVDAICTGEGEYPTLEIVTAMEAGKDFTHVDTMAFNINGKVIRNPNRPFINKEGLSDIPFPDRELIRPFSVWNHRTGYIMAGRGCPYDCTFCFNRMSRDSQEGRWTRHRSVDNVLAELHWLKDKYKVIYVAFQDDTFILNKRWLRDFLPRYAREIGLPFICNVRGDLADEEQVRMLAEANCTRVAMGLESGSEELRTKILAKNISNEQIIHACDLFNRYGIKVCGHNMFGVPGETVETAISTIELNIRCKTHINLFYFFAPYPGTKLGQIAQECGFSGEVEDIPREYQDCLASTIQLEDKEIIEKIGQCAHLFVSYPRLYRFAKTIFRLLPGKALKLIFLSQLYRLKQELAKRGKAGLPSLWHPPDFIVHAIHTEPPEIPMQPVAREIRHDKAA